MGRSPYPEKMKIEARRLYVEDGRQPHWISQYYGGNPVPQTVLNWSNALDAGGKTWHDHRREHLDALYGEITPGSLAQWIMAQIHDLKKSGEGHVKNADALAKYVKSLEKLVDPVYQMTMTYDVLERFAAFAAESYPELVKSGMVEALRAYKNQEYRRLMGRAPS